MASKRKTTILGGSTPKQTQPFGMYPRAECGLHRLAPRAFALGLRLILGVLTSRRVVKMRPLNVYISIQNVRGWCISIYAYIARKSAEREGPTF